MFGVNILSSYQRIQLYLFSQNLWNCFTCGNKKILISSTGWVWSHSVYIYRDHKLAISRKVRRSERQRRCSFMKIHNYKSQFTNLHRQSIVSVNLPWIIVKSTKTSSPWNSRTPASRIPTQFFSVGLTVDKSAISWHLVRFSTNKKQAWRLRMPRTSGNKDLLCSWLLISKYFFLDLEAVLTLFLSLFNVTLSFKVRQIWLRGVFKTAANNKGNWLHKE